MFFPNHASIYLHIVFDELHPFYSVVLTFLYVTHAVDFHCLLFFVNNEPEKYRHGRNQAA
jgi:hypothetical protein